MTRPIVLGFLAGAIGFVCGVIAAILYERPEPETLPNFPETRWIDSGHLPIPNYGRTQ